MEPHIGRRNFLRTAFWSGIALGGLGGVAAVGRFLYPRPKSEEARRYVVLREDVPIADGIPFFHTKGKFFLVHLAPATSGSLEGGSGLVYPLERGAGGVLALSNVCTHLNCTVRWEANERMNETAEFGLFDCRCHGARYTKSGSMLFGPITRSLRTARVIVSADGSVEVDTSRMPFGLRDNSLNATPYPLASD